MRPEAPSQRYKADLRFDQNNRMYVTVPVNTDNAANIFNYVVAAYSDDGGKSFHRISSDLISPLPMGVIESASQSDILAGYTNADMGEHSGILLNSNNAAAIYYSIDGGTWYRYDDNHAWSTPQAIFTTKQCDRCFMLSDQDNGVMTIIDQRNWYRFSDFGEPLSSYQIDVPILRWDLRALREKHVYRGVYWYSKTGQWGIYRVDITNPSKCY